MKTIAIILFTFLTLASCNEQVKQTDRTKETKPSYQNISETSISLGEHNALLHGKPTADNNYLLYIRTARDATIPKDDYYFLKINNQGDSIHCLPVRFEYSLTDYIELDSFYIVVTTDRRTMGGYTKDFLNKYDKNWKLIWSKKINHPKYPDGSTVVTLTRNNELLVLADEFVPKTVEHGMSIRRYHLDGTLIAENLMLTKELTYPISITPSADNHFYVTAGQYDQTTGIPSLWLIKLTQKGDTVWTKKHPYFYAKQTIVTSNENLVFYGSNFSPPAEQKNHYEYIKIIVLDKNGNLQWEKEMKQNYYEKPGNCLETKDGNYLFASTITPIQNKGDKAYLFELTKKGELTFERTFDYSVGISSVPYLIRTEGQITMIGQKWMGKFGEPFKDIIQITKLTD